MTPATFSCKQCRWTVATPLCPGCNQYLTDDIDLVESLMPSEPAAPGPICWATAFGHWGDVFACCGVMRAIMAKTGQRQCNVLYVGPDLSIGDWLREQDFVQDVIALRVTNTDVYPRFWQITAHSGTQPNDWLPILRNIDMNVPSGHLITQTHINMEWFHKQAVQLWHDGRLPEQSREWARKAYGEAVRGQSPNAKVIHFHPVSVWSETQQNHWPHWKDALELLLRSTSHTYVMTGLQPIENCCRSDRLIDFIGRTPGNMEVLALSEMCDAVIATPNNIALWSVIQRQKALVFGNAATKFLSSYYTRFLLRGEKMKYLSVDATLTDFADAVFPWLEEV